MTETSKNVHIGKLDYIVYEYKKTYHRIMEMKPIVVKKSTHIDFIVEKMNQDARFKFRVHVTV